MRRSNRGAASTRTRCRWGSSGHHHHRHRRENDDGTRGQGGDNHDLAAETIDRHATEYYDGGGEYGGEAVIQINGAGSELGLW